MYRGLRYGRQVRLYSTEGSGDKKVFLSDLLARIEKMNIKKNSNSENELKDARMQANKRKDTRTKAGDVIQTNFKTKEPKNSSSAARPSDKVTVADHPLFRTRLNKTPLQSERRPRTRRATTPIKSDARPRRPANSRPRTPRTVTSASDSIALVSKEVNAKDFSPSLTNHFLYGKSTNFQINLTSRITSLVKTQLIKSNYPYLVPRSIINSVPPNKDSPNRFLVSDDFSLEINQDDLKQDFDSVVLGKPHNLAGSSHSIDNLNKNPTLSHSQKSTMSDIINSKDFSSVFSKAHWNS